VDHVSIAGQPVLMGLGLRAIGLHERRT
jgi:hypothetical protein